jgi:cobalt-zinc-cadmium efflux system outer membrane protein
LTLEQAEGIALANNASLGRAAARVSAARGRWLQAGLYPNPEVGYVASEIGNEGSAGQQGGMVAQQIITAGKLRLSREVAARDVAVAEQELAAQRLRVLTDVRVVFYELLVNQTRVALAQQLMTIGERGIKIAEGLLKAKEVAQADVLRAQVELETARIELRRSQFARSASWRNLVAIMGTFDMPCAEAAGALEVAWPEYDWCVTLQQLLSRSPEMGAAVMRVERARWALRRANVEPIPDVNVQGMVQRDDATRDTIFGAQATVALPIFNRNQGNISAAQSELIAAQHDTDRVAAALQQRLAPAFQAYEAARFEAERYQKVIIPSAERILEQVTLGYRQSEFSYTDLLTAQRTYFQARLSYLETLRQLRVAVARIDGLLLSDSLKD